MFILDPNECFCPRQMSHHKMKSSVRTQGRKRKSTMDRADSKDSAKEDKTEKKRKRSRAG